MGDPFAGLTPEQRQVLTEITKLGFPLRGWWQYASLTGGSFLAVAGGVRALDPTYVTDFWTKPGYEGTNPNSSVLAARVQHDAAVVSLVGSPTAGVVLSSVPSADLTDADLVLTSGAASGKTLTVGSASGTTVRF